MASLPIFSTTIDFLYNDFIREFRKTKYYTKEYLSQEEMQKKSDDIKKLIERLYEERT